MASLGSSVEHLRHSYNMQRNNPQFLLAPGEVPLFRRADSALRLRQPIGLRFDPVIGSFAEPLSRLERRLANEWTV